MSQVYVVGQMTVKNEEKWARYRAQVLATMTPFGGELVFRGEQVNVFSGSPPHPDMVVIRFPSASAAQGWHASVAYQALIALRQEAADVILVTYQT